MTIPTAVERNEQAPSPPSPAGAEALAPALPGAACLSLTHPSATSAALTVAGEIDLVTVERLAEVLLAVLAMPRCRELLVDLDHVSFLGAAGIGVFARVQQRAAQRGIAVRLVAISGVARRAFEITRSTACFDTWPSWHSPNVGCSASRSINFGRGNRP